MIDPFICNHVIVAFIFGNLCRYYSFHVMFATLFIAPKHHSIYVWCNLMLNWFNVWQCKKYLKIHFLLINIDWLLIKYSLMVINTAHIDDILIIAVVDVSLDPDWRDWPKANDKIGRKSPVFCSIAIYPLVCVFTHF